MGLSTGLGLPTQSICGLAPARTASSVLSPAPPRPGPSFLCFSQTAPNLTLPYYSPHPPQPPSAVLFALCPPRIPSPGTETRLGGAASIFLLPGPSNPAVLRQGEVSGEVPWHQQVLLASAPPGLHPGLTKAEPQFFTLADVRELQHLPPFLAFAFAIPATTCGSKQALSWAALVPPFHPQCSPEV